MNFGSSQVSASYITNVTLGNTRSDTKFYFKLVEINTDSN